MVNDRLPDGYSALRDNITTLVRRWGAGDALAQEELFSVVYGDLRRLAQSVMAKQKAGTISPTALVHEAYIRLHGRLGEVFFENRYQFFHFVAKIMRHILVDIFRRKQRPIHGGDLQSVPFSELEQQMDQAELEPWALLSLDQALEAFAAIDQESVELLELRFFAGLSVQEIAAYVGKSSATVDRRLLAARVWLRHFLEGERV